MNEEMWRQRIACVSDFLRSGPFRPEAENDAWRDVGIHAGGDCASAQRQGFQLAGMCFEVLRQVDAEIGQRQIGNRHTGGKVFEVDHRVLQLEQLLSSVFQVVHRVAGLLLDQVFFTGC